MRVIDLLEVVYVQHADGKRLLVALPALHLRRSQLQPGTAGQSAGQAVVRGQVFKLRAHALAGHQQHTHTDQQYRKAESAQVRGLGQRGGKAVRVCAVQPQRGQPTRHQHQCLGRQPPRRQAAGKPMAVAQQQAHMGHADQRQGAGEDQHAHPVVGLPPQEDPHQHQRAKRHCTPPPPSHWLAKKALAAKQKKTKPCHQQPIASQHEQPVRQHAVEHKKHRGRRAQQRCQPPPAPNSAGPGWMPENSRAPRAAPSPAPQP